MGDLFIASDHKQGLVARDGTNKRNRNLRLLYGGRAMKNKIKLCNSLEGEESMQKKDFTVTGFLSNFEAGVTFTFRGTDSEFSKWFDGENLRELEEVEISTETLT